MTRLGRPRVFPDIVAEHLDELDFLWEHREANVFTADWNLYQLADHEERAEAHLDGLRLSELVGVDLARERLACGQTFAATAATLVLHESGEAEHLELALAALRGGDPLVADGVRIALRHCPPGLWRSAVETIASSADPIHAVAAADVLAFHRLPVPRLEALLAEPDPWVLSLALGAAGRLGRVRDKDLASALQHADAYVRRAALFEAARNGLPGLLQHCVGAATRRTDPDPMAAYCLGVLGSAAELPTLQAALERPDLVHSVIAGIGALGRVEAVPLLLDLMSDPVLGVMATAAYRRITGARDVEGSKPFPPPVPEGRDEDESLPPDPAKARRDWQERQPKMAPAHRWQSGTVIEEGRLPDGFHHLPLEVRRDVYLALRSRRATPDRELEALAVVQLRS